MGEATANFITTLYKGGYISIDDLHLAPVRTTTACRYHRGFINISNIFNHLIKKTWIYYSVDDVLQCNI